MRYICGKMHSIPYESCQRCSTSRTDRSVGEFRDTTRNGARHAGKPTDPSYMVWHAFSRPVMTYDGLRSCSYSAKRFALFLIRELQKTSGPLVYPVF